MKNKRVRLISVTPDAEKHIAYVARVSNPKNQENEKFSGLLKYCIKPVSYTHLTLPTKRIV